jgi:plastocyanin
MARLRLSVFAFAMLGASGLVAAGCGSSSTSPSAAPSTGASAPNTVTIPAGTTSFAPATLNVDAGTTVVWQNKDSTVHTTTSDTAGLWNTTLAPGQEFSRTFPTAGTFAYRCTIHAGMTGTVVVK